MTTVRKLIISCGVFALAGAGGCGGPTTRAPKDGVPPASSSVVTPQAADFRVADILNELPASAYQVSQLPAGVSRTFTVYAGDLTGATALAGLERPKSLADTPNWLSLLTGTSSTEGQPPVVFVPLDVPLSSAAPADLVEQDLGWSVADVESFVSYEVVGFPSTTLAHGNFSSQTLADLAEVGAGVRSAGKGPDLKENLGSATPARPSGIPLRMAVEKGQLIASSFTPVVEDWVEGRGASVGHDPTLSEMADILDDADAYSALFATPVSLAALPDTDMNIEAGDLASFDAYAIGWSVDQGRPRITVLYHPTQDIRSARRQVAARWSDTTFDGAPLSELVDVGKVSIEGGLVKVDLRPAPQHGPEVVFYLHESQDLPFVASQ